MDITFLKPSNWTRVVVNYLASASDYFEIGTIFFNNNLKINGQVIKNVTKKLDVTKFQSKYKYGITSFVSAFSSNAPKFQFRIVKETFNPLSGDIVIEFNATSNVDRFQFSYIVYQITNTTYTIEKYQETPTSFAGVKFLTEKLLSISLFPICYRPECRQNQVEVNGTCQCQEGFLRIGSICRISCQNSAFINDYGECICIQGYNRIGGTGNCSKCQDGEYYDESNLQCYACPLYCASCKDSFECNRCWDGFTLSQQDFFGYILSSCTSVCGDGQRSDVEECDDGNDKSGDGCDQKCKIQANYSCILRPGRPDICNKFEQNRNYLTLTRSITLQNRTAVQVYLERIPSCFTINKNDICLDCDVIFDATVIDSQIPMKPSVQSMGGRRFVINFNYLDGKRLLNPFKFRIKFNAAMPENYRKCFSKQDFQPQFVRVINPANY